MISDIALKEVGYTEGAAKESAKAVALAKLAALGLTADDVAAIL